MLRPAFSGVMTAIATPFTKSGDIDQVAFRTLLKQQKKAGIFGVVVAGTTGESPTLSESEREALVLMALEERTPQFQIYVGTGTNDTRSTLAASQKYASMKNPVTDQSVDGVMVVVPYYNKPSQTGLFEHFKTIAQGIGGASLCVYNVPGRTGATLAPSTFVKLAKENTNIVAIKEAAGDVRVINELCEGLAPVVRQRQVLKQPGIEILSGDDPTFAPALLCGATGVISVTTHLIPGAMVAMLEAFRKGDFNTLQSLHLATYRLNADLFCAPNPMALKWALSYLRVCEGYVRSPLSVLESREIEIVKNALTAMEINGIKLLA